MPPWVLMVVLLVLLEKSARARLNTTCVAFGGSLLPCTHVCVLKGNVSLPWPQAREFCRSVGGELAILKTEWELKMLYNFLKGDEEDFDPHWIGARRIDGATHKVRTHYKWNDGSEIPKNFWVERTHFLNGCVFLYYPGSLGSHLYSLEDFYCTQSWPFVCELTHRS